MNGKIFTLRLKTSEKLRATLQKFCADNGILAGGIVTCVGALSSATLRMAGATPTAQDVRTYDEDFEIVSLVGTLTDNDCHLHLSIANRDGAVIGGHLKEATINITTEIVILDDRDKIYATELDDTGFTCLSIKERNDKEIK
ncbi:MAG: DNA-binding protein [Candidatus Nomurabacteria bacterium]|jgi:predicted DNA-binding protein with PD1-like motif|nr:DNA-binding protein [Candidatus Nomurabacteria bacterium]